jgi:hypothetical protein
MKQEIQLPHRQAIDRVERPTQEVFQHEYLARGRPVIISGMMKDWRALSLWNAAYFKSALGYLNTLVAASPTQTFSGDPKTGFSGRGIRRGSGTG